MEIKMVCGFRLKPLTPHYFEMMFHHQTTVFFKVPVPSILALRQHHAGRLRHCDQRNDLLFGIKAHLRPPCVFESTELHFPALINCIP